MIVVEKFSFCANKRPNKTFGDDVDVRIHRPLVTIGSDSCRTSDGAHHQSSLNLLLLLSFALFRVPCVVFRVWYIVRICSLPCVLHGCRPWRSAEKLFGIECLTWTQSHTKWYTKTHFSSAPHTIRTDMSIIHEATNGAYNHPLRSLIIDIESFRLHRRHGHLLGHQITGTLNWISIPSNAGLLLLVSKCQSAHASHKFQVIYRWQAMHSKLMAVTVSPFTIHPIWHANWLRQFQSKAARSILLYHHYSFRHYKYVIMFIFHDGCRKTSSSVECGATTNCQCYSVRTIVASIGCNPIIIMITFKGRFPIETSQLASADSVKETLTSFPPSISGLCLQ